MIADVLDFGAEAAAARAAGRPIVALESTIVAHGMPWPRNLETARAVHQKVRDNGAVPATVAVIDGRPTIGLDDGQLERIARGGEAVVKASTRDLPVLMAEGATGAVTVAATMMLAAAANIRVFATGGIGGVHRGWARHGDVSADLDALARYSVAVVCAGAKTILDVAATLEALESRGVPVIGYGCDTFPGFYVASTGLAVQTRADHVDQLAAIVRAQDRLGVDCGAVIANPPPAADALPGDEAEKLIAAALAAAERRDIAGKALTPFLLAHIAEASGGRSLAANIALAFNNASLAARLAAALAPAFAGD